MTNQNYDRIIVCGSVAYDEIMDFPKQFVNYFDPTKLHQINVSFVVNRLEKQLGGTGTNIAYNLSLLSSKSVKLLAAVGRDGNDFIRFLQTNTLDTDGIIIDESLYTATGKVITDIKDNQIWGFYYGALEKAKNIDFRKHITQKSLVIVSATHPEAFVYFQNSAIQLKLDYLYDPGMTLTWIKKNDLIDGIINCCWLVGNDYEITHILQFTGLKIAELIKKNIAVITTMGEKGVKYQDKDDNFFVQAFLVKEVLDPTGAGDAWRAGFIAAIVEGYEIKEALKQGNALASFVVEKYGTVNHKPTREEIKDRVSYLKTVISY